MIQALAYKDFYKADHRRQYPKETQLIYSNFTARTSRIPGVDRHVVFGIQYFLKDYLIRRFNEGFFKRPKDQAVAQYKRRLDTSLGMDMVPVDHIEALWDLGYLPLHIKALPEGSICPLRVPCLTIWNTRPDFFWLTNFVETILSNVLWGPMTSATIAHEYRKILDSYALETAENLEFVPWQGHDFSMRGMMGLEAALMSGAAHLLSFTGTDTIPAIDFLEHFYNADASKELIGGSVPATEHSVMCAGGQLTELETYHRLLTQVYPSGIVSIVSDTWDYWSVLTHTLPVLKNVIMARDGKVVIRPDSGDPVKVICGDENAAPGSAEYQGSVELLWKNFGGTINSKGFKQLDSHVGLIYGDSITLDRCRQICEGLKKKGFSSTNMVFGIGSYTYQYVTRDTLGFAMKSTYAEVDGQCFEIFKNPKTDSGIKKSAKGLLRVENGVLEEGVSWEREGGDLKTVFLDGVLHRDQTLADIRGRLSR